MSDTLHQTHVKFSQLVKDETLLKPQLDDETLLRDTRTIQQAYKDNIRSLHDSVAEALKNVKTQLQDDEIAGLHGVDSGETFDIDELVAQMTGEEVIERSPEGQRRYKDYLIKTVDRDDNPDPNFVVFSERRTFVGIRSSAGTQEHDLRYSELQEEMRNLEELIEGARKRGDEQEVQRLTRMRQAIQADFRTGESDATHPWPKSEARSPDRVRDEAPASYSERKQR